MKNLVFTLVFLFLITLNQASFAAPAKPAAGQSSETSTLGYLYQLTFAAERLEALKALPISLRVTTATGEPVTLRNILCDLTMPAMAMPLNRPTLKESGKPGIYQGVILLTMSGLWQMQITAIDKSGRQDNVVLSFIGLTPTTGEDSDTVNKRLEELFQNEGKDKK